MANPATKIDHFDKDPDWEGRNNRIVADRAPKVTQDFGYSRTNFAGKERGELGGQVARASEPAYDANCSASAAQATTTNPPPSRRRTWH